MSRRTIDATNRRFIRLTIERFFGSLSLIFSSGSFISTIYFFIFYLEAQICDQAVLAAVTTGALFNTTECQVDVETATGSYQMLQANA